MVTSFTSDGPTGNIFDYTPAITNLALLGDILSNPENHYVNLHTSLDPGGTMLAACAHHLYQPTRGRNHRGE